MKGTIGEIRRLSPEQFEASVMLEGETTPRPVTFWSELTAKWAPEAVRAWIVAQAAAQADSERAAAARDEAVLAGLAGEAEAAPVCLLGVVGCEVDHDLTDRPDGSPAPEPEHGPAEQTPPARDTVAP